MVRGGGAGEGGGVGGGEERRGGEMVVVGAERRGGARERKGEGELEGGAKGWSHVRGHVYMIRTGPLGRAMGQRPATGTPICVPRVLC